ncbi:MAG: endonuclease domain-containing protein [Anaerolineales bacterium]|nr:endonuclease domain-containing protein [Anaerolineales bacterium]
MSGKTNIEKHFIKIQYSRTNRKQQTAAEKKLWGLVRNRNLDGYKFRRQHPISHFIVDFYCAELKLVIEVDGPYHKYQQLQDAERTAHLEYCGCTVIRFTNQSVLDDTDKVINTIKRICNRLKHKKWNPEM